MIRTVYRRALELERQTLLDEITRLKSITEYAVGGKRLRCAQQLRALERQQNEIGERLRSLQAAGDGGWRSVRVAFRWIVDEFVRATERWAEQVSTRQSLARKPSNHDR